MDRARGNLRIFSKILNVQLVIVIFLVLKSINTELLFVRIWVLVLFSIFKFFDYLTHKSDFIAANYSHLSNLLFGIYCAEMTARRETIGIYEGFIPHFGCSYLFLTLVWVDWKASCIVQALVYAYSVVRIKMTFEDVPPSMYVAFFNALLFFTLSAYFLWRSFRSEFIAKYTQQKSAEQSQRTWFIMPEGVTIFNNQSSEIEFMNPKFKEILDIHKYLENPESKVFNVIFLSNYSLF